MIMIIHDFEAKKTPSSYWFENEANCYFHPKKTFKPTKCS